MNLDGKFLTQKPKLNHQAMTFMDSYSISSYRQKATWTFHFLSSLPQSSIYHCLFRSARASWNTFVRPLVRPQGKFGSHIYRLICLMNHLKTHQTSLMAPWDPLDALLTPWDPLGPPGPPHQPPMTPKQVTCSH